MRSVRNGMEAAGIPIECSKGESGPGQTEINLLYAPALEMADRHVIYKNGVKELAQAEGKSATFMAKWHDQQPGSSCHIHSSIWQAGARGHGLLGSRRPHGMSAVFEHWLAGQIALARELTMFLAPFLNSYKRFQAGSFAPTRTVWSLDNRTAAFRVLGEGASQRVECRVPGADVNPYLAYAALVAAGLHGIAPFPAAAPAAGRQCLPRPGRAADPDQPARGHRGPRWLGGAARGLGRRGGRPLCPRGPMGAGRKPTAASPTGKWPATSSGPDRCPSGAFQCLPIRPGRRSSRRWPSSRPRAPCPSACRVTNRAGRPRRTSSAARREGVRDRRHDPEGDRRPPRDARSILQQAERLRRRGLGRGVQPTSPPTGPASATTPPISASRRTGRYRAGRAQSPQVGHRRPDHRQAPPGLSRARPRPGLGHRARHPRRATLERSWPRTRKPKGVFIVSPSFYGVASDLAPAGRGLPPPRQAAGGGRGLGAAYRLPAGSCRRPPSPPAPTSRSAASTRPWPGCRGRRSCCSTAG